MRTNYLKTVTLSEAKGLVDRNNRFLVARGTTSLGFETVSKNAGAHDQQQGDL